MFTQNLGKKITVRQLRPLKQWLKGYREAARINFAWMAQKCELGRGTIAAICALNDDGLEESAVLDRAPTWRLVCRIANGLNVPIETLIPLEFQQNLETNNPLSHEEEVPKVPHTPYSLTEIGIIGTEKCQKSALYNLAVSQEEKWEFHILLIHKAVGEALATFHNKDAKDCGESLARIVIMVASLAYQFGVDLEVDVAKLATKYRHSLQVKDTAS